jgi:elongator complex protein 1
MKLVLQMPRGNLESIYPRALVLSVVRSSLTTLDFKTAFVLCRKHRIDMNLIVDHNPESFMGHVRLFIQQVAEVDYLNLFVSSLRDEDVTVTMYPSSTSTGSIEYFK